jgi:mono/diheme cytochrome c family protein
MLLPTNSYRHALPAIGFMLCANALLAAPDSASTARAALDKYCVGCHNQKLKTANLMLDNADLTKVSEQGEMWEKVILKLKLGMMPPPGLPRPDENARLGVVQYLQTELDRAAAAHPNPGRPLVHRLNRAEYGNAIRDLLGFDVDVATLLPPDDSSYGFDNVAEALGTSPALLQAYLAAARKISAVAVGDPHIGAGGVTYSVRQDLSQDTHIEGLPLGTTGGAVFRHVFPADGYYDFRLRLYRTNLDTTRGLEQPHRMELSIDGERVLLATIGGNQDLAALQKNTTDVSDAIEANRLRIRVFVKAGERDVAAAFIEEVAARFATRRLQSFVRDFSTYDAEGAPHLKSLTIQGPFESKGAADPAGRIFACRPVNASDEIPCARRILSAVAHRAWRRNLTSVEIDGLMSFYQTGRKTGNFDSGVEFALRRILAAPSFVYRAEIEPGTVKPGETYRIGDFELASRLSFFLWSSIPDDTLLDLAAQNKLHQPAVLAREVRRMIADPRGEALVSNFAGQWLQLRNLQGIQPDPEKFPDFDDNLRQAFRREAELFFESIVKEDRPVPDLMTADYTFVNERLARHYGIPGVVGSDFRRVTLVDDERRGLLGKGAVLMVTSHANATSPVLRGKWVLENILGSPVPPPPPDVPALKETEPGATPRTMREQMEQHRANPVCAGCHKTTDPIGFALENFNEVGGWRTSSEGGVALNTAVTLADGTKVDGARDLRMALTKDPETFVQTFTEKLLVYALGRGVTWQDMPAIRHIIGEAQPQDYRFSALVLGIVESVPFEMRMKVADQGE